MSSKTWGNRVRAPLTQGRRYVQAGLLSLCLMPWAAWANSAHDKLAAMSELDRSEALAIFVESSGHACRTVARTFFQGQDSKGHALWNVECDGGVAYLVVVLNDARGSTRVMTCQRLKAMAGGACFSKLE